MEDRYKFLVLTGVVLLIVIIGIILGSVDVMFLGIVILVIALMAVLIIILDKFFPKNRISKGLSHIVDFIIEGINPF